VLASQSPKIFAATKSAAPRAMPGVTCEYRSRVMAMVEWPRRSDTIFGWTPAFSASVA